MPSKLQQPSTPPADRVESPLPTDNSSVEASPRRALLNVAFEYSFEGDAETLDAYANVERAFARRCALELGEDVTSLEVSIALVTAPAADLESPDGPALVVLVAHTDPQRARAAVDRAIQRSPPPLPVLLTQGGTFVDSSGAGHDSLPNALASLCLEGVPAPTPAVERALLGL
jgi:hypothetical protein